MKGCRICLLFVFLSVFLFVFYGLLCGLFCDVSRCGLVSSAQAQTGQPVTAVGGKNDSSPVIVKESGIQDWLKGEVERRGGDWKTQRYHFYIGLSTGHFATDRVHAIGMRKLVVSLLNRTFVQGDIVTPFAWEMTVWNYGHETTLDDSSESRSQVFKDVPDGVQAGSEGGHDPEEVLYYLLKNKITPTEARSSIVLLITTTTGGQAPTGQTHVKMRGENDAELQAEANRLGFDLPASKCEVAVTVEGSKEADKVTEKQVGVIALLPKKIVSLLPTTQPERQPLAEKLQITDPKFPVESKAVKDTGTVAKVPTNSGQDTDGNKSGWGVALFAAVALVAALILLVVFMKRGKEKGKTVADASSKSAQTTPSAQSTQSTSKSVSAGAGKPVVKSQPQTEARPTLPRTATSPSPIAEPTVFHSPEAQKSEPEPEEPAGQPVPGGLEVIVANTAYPIGDLSTSRRWQILQMPDLSAVLIEFRQGKRGDEGDKEPEENSGTPLAALSFAQDDAPVLILQAEDTVQITNHIGTDYVVSSSSQLRLSPEGMLNCVLELPSSQRVLIEIQYKKS